MLCGRGICTYAGGLGATSARGDTEVSAVDYFDLLGCDESQGGCFNAEPGGVVGPVPTCKHSKQPKKVSKYPLPAKISQLDSTTHSTSNMAKRSADASEQEIDAIKNGDRPMEIDQVDNEVGEFEDEFEDEFESEDEILEAGVDGRPDEEREAEEKEGMYRFYGLCLCIG